jgi:hypothetical protein
MSSTQSPLGRRYTTVWKRYRRMPTDGLKSIIRSERIQVSIVLVKHLGRPSWIAGIWQMKRCWISYNRSITLLSWRSQLSDEVLAITSNESLGYIYYYNNLREHSSLGFKTPFTYLKQQLSDIDDKIRFVIPIMLDKVAVELGSWSGYHVLAQHLMYKMN